LHRVAYRLGWFDPAPLSGRPSTSIRVICPGIFLEAVIFGFADLDQR